MLKAIERTRAQFAQAEPVRGPKWFKLANDVVAFTPTLRGGQPLPVNGQTTVFMPSDRFPEFLDHMQAAVEAGEFDKELTVPGDASATVAMPNAPKKGGWSDARRARYKGTMAARNAAKAD